MMISQTSEETAIPASPDAEKRSKQDSKSRKLGLRAFNFFRRNDSRRENTAKKEETQQKEDLVEVKIVDSKIKNDHPKKSSFNFFDNVKRHLQVRKLAIRKSKQKVNEIQESSSQDDTKCKSLILCNDKSTVSLEEYDSNKFNSESDTETSVNSCDNETPEKAIAEESFLSREFTSNNQESVLDNYSERKTEVENIAEDNLEENYYKNVLSAYQPHSNYVQQLDRSITEYHRRNYGIETIQENTGSNESMNNDNKAKASLTEELLKLSNYGWYWGPISGNEADAKLKHEPDGAFLIRDSSDDRYVLTLSFKTSGKLLHARLEHSGGLFSLCHQSESEGFSSVSELIDYTMNFSQSSVFCYSRPRRPGYLSFPVRLTKPVSRFTQVRSLQYLCRFVIRQNTRLDNIPKLPLPKTIKGYIEEAHY